MDEVAATALPPARRRRAAPLLLALPALVLLLAHLGYYLAALGFDAIDDAYISFRYALNLASGQGLVFNPGERVQGYTNFLWTVLLAPAIATGLPPAAVALALGGLSAVGVLLLVTRWGKERLPLVGLLAALLLAADGSFALWSVSGMETTAFTLLLVAGATRYWREAACPAARPWSGLLFGLATLTRPEGALVFACTALDAALGRVIQRRSPLTRQDVGRVLLFVPIVGAYGAFSRLYYGSWLPNTFTAKVDLGSTAQLARGWQALVTFAGIHGGWPLLLLPLGAGALVAAGDRRRAGYCLLLILPYVAYIAAIGGDWSVGRFFVPILPFAYFLAAAGLATLARGLAGAGRAVGAGPARNGGGAPLVGAVGRPAGARAWLAGAAPGEGGPVGSTRVAVALAAALACVVFVESSAFGERLLFVDQFQVQEVGRARTAMGRWLQANTPPGATLAIDAAGQVPYYARRRAIDLYGLNDPNIARQTTGREGTALAGHEKFGLDYALRVDQPRYVAIYGHLLDAPVYRRLYHRVDTWTADPTYRALLGLYERDPPGGPAPCHFVLAFQAIHDLLPAQVGACVEEEYYDQGMAQTLQHTTRGVLVRSVISRWPAFTDGYRTWIDGPNGLQERLNSERFPWEPNPGPFP